MKRLAKMDCLNMSLGGELKSGDPILFCPTSGKRTPMAKKEYHYI